MGQQPSHWLNDEDVLACPVDGIVFDTFQRRHHCRKCGGIFCTNCCPDLHNNEFERLCIRCEPNAVIISQQQNLREQSIREENLRNEQQMKQEQLNYHNSHKERMIVIGGGFAGVQIAKKAKQFFQVTMIDLKEYFENTPSVPRALIQPERSKLIIVPHERNFPSSSNNPSSFLKGRVIEIKLGNIIGKILSIANKINKRVTTELSIVEERRRERVG